MCTETKYFSGFNPKPYLKEVAHESLFLRRRANALATPSVAHRKDACVLTTPASGNSLVLTLLYPDATIPVLSIGYALIDSNLLLGNLLDASDNKRKRSIGQAAR